MLNSFQQSSVPSSLQYGQCIRSEISKMCLHYARVMPKIIAEKGLESIKQRVTRSHFIRIHQSVEHWPAVVEGLRARLLPKGIIDVIFQYVDTVGKNTFNPLMICVWQSDASRSVRTNLIGSPPCAIEFLNGCDVHRDDVDLKKLTSREKLSYELNTFFIDEVWVEQVVYPELKQMKDWVTLFSALCYDDAGNYFILAFFFTTFSHLEKNDHIIEFGWRMNIPSNQAVDAIRYMKAHNIDMNLMTGEITMEHFG